MASTIEVINLSIGANYGYDKYVASLYPDEPRTPQQPLRQGQIAR